MDRYLTGKRGSVHEVGLADLIDMSRLTGDMPAKRCLIGIQPQSLDWGERPSAAVAAAIPAAVGMVLDTIRGWTGLDPSA
jgi:hydrogenase maturation protease